MGTPRPRSSPLPGRRRPSRRPSDSKDAATATAAFRVLVTLFPAQQTWTPLFDPSTPVATPSALVTPPFPEHPSGHNCAGGAIVRTLQYFFGTDNIAFSAASNKSGTTRNFQRFSAALEENVNARVWAGIHIGTADIQGAKLGREVARRLHRHDFRPAP